jgi:hypothetical protein
MTRLRCAGVLIVALFATPSAAPAAEPISQFHLAPNAAVTTKVKMKARELYPMEITGTRKKTTLVGSTERTWFEDAFSCWGTTTENVPDCSKTQTDIVSLTARTSETTTLHPLQEFVPIGQTMINSPDWRHPPFETSHSYNFFFRPKLSGALILATSETCSSPARCSGLGFEVKIYEPQEPEEDPCKKSRARAAAVNEVRVVAVAQGAAFHKAGTPEDAWETLCPDTVLQQGDEISVDPDGAITLQFADNSTTVVKNTTQLKIASYFTEGGVVKTEILLRMGEIAAKVCKSCATKSDFRIKSPTGTASVRGTDFSVSYDPGGKAMLTTVREGLVEVDPEGAGLATTLVPAGKEVEVTAKAISPIAAIGKAGARGGLNRFAALKKVMKVIARGNGPCRSSTPRANAFGIAPKPGAWAVSVKLTGKLKGTSKWTVKGSRVKPANTRAKRIAKRCK